MALGKQFSKCGLGSPEGSPRPFPHGQNDFLNNTKLLFALHPPLSVLSNFPETRCNLFQMGNITID